MGLVYRAWDRDLRRWVALKFLKQIGDGEARALFHREAQLAARLDHANIARIYEVGEHEGAPFLAMQFVDGSTLAAARSTLDVDGRLRAVEKIAEAVRYAHRNRVIHRDLKPANVMIDREGNVYVMDFGLAKEMAVDGQSLASGQILGTPNYMAPEQAQGRADAQSDVYGIGAILYELLTGRPPFTGATVTEILAKLLIGEPIRPRELDPRLAPDLEAIVLKAIEKEKNRRYSDPGQFLEDFLAFRRGDPVRYARRATLAYVLGKKIRRQPLLWGSVGASVLAILAGATFGVSQLVRAKRAADERVRVEREEGAKTAAALKRVEAERRIANERLAHSLRLRARQSADAGDHVGAAIFAAESYAAHPDDLGRAEAAARCSVLYSLHRMLPHAGPVTCVAVHPDGTRLLTAAQDGEVRVWNASSGAPEGKTMPHARGVCAAAFSPDGRRLATGGFEGVVRFWDVATGESRNPEIRTGDVIWCLSFSPDGRSLAIGSQADRLRVHRTDTGERVSESPPTHGDIQCLAFSPDGRLVAGGSKYGKGVVWEASTGAVSAEYDHPWEVEAIAFTPAGDRVWSASVDSIHVWDPRTGQAIRKPMAVARNLAGMALERDGSRAYVSAEEGGVRVIDLERGESSGIIVAHPGPRTALAIAPDGKFAVTGGEDGTVRIWTPPASDRQGRVLRMDEAPQRILFSPGTARVAARSENSVVLWDGRTGRPVPWATKLRDHRVVSLEFGADERHLLVGTAEGWAEVWDAQSGEALGRRMVHGEAIRRVAFRPDGRVVATGSGTHRVRLWDAVGGKPIGEPLVHHERLEALAFSPDGALLATVTTTVRLWNATSGESVPFSADLLAVASLSFAPSGKFLALSDELETDVALVDLRGAEPLVKNLRHPKSVADVAMSPDGRVLATACSDGRVRFWDPATGTPILKAILVGDRAEKLVFSSDGRFVAIGGPGMRAQWWSVERAEPVGLPFHAASLITAMVLSRDGRLLAVGDSTGVRLYEADFLQDETPPAQRLALAQRRTGMRLDRTGEVEGIPPAELKRMMEKAH